MIKQDYVERLIQQIAQLLAILLTKKSPSASLEVIDENYDSWLGLSRQDVAKLDEGELLEKLTVEGKLNVHHLEFLAYLLGEEGRVYFKEKAYDKSKQVVRKALLIFDYVDEEQGVYNMERVNYIKKLKELL